MEVIMSAARNSRSSEMFSGKENRRKRKMDNLFLQIFERKKRIIEQVKQNVDFFDKHLASKCLLAGVPPPSWLWSPSLPAQTSELNKEEVISEFLLPPSRPSIICPSSRLFPYQQPVRLLAEHVVRKGLQSVPNNPLEEQLCEEEPQDNLSHSLVRRVSNQSEEQGANIASPSVDLETESVPHSVSLSCRESQCCPSAEHYQNQRVETNLDVTSPGCSRGKKVLKSVSTTDCERKSSPPRYCEEETEPNNFLDTGLSLAKMQRSRSRQKALELRSSAKASKSHTNSRNELKHSLGGYTSHKIASLRSGSLSGIKLFNHDENNEGRGDEVETKNSQGKKGDKVGLTTESFTLRKEAMKLEWAIQEQENLIKQKIEKKKKEEDQKKKEAERVWKQEMEKKKKEDERKRKEFEMADRKRQREKEDKKFKEAKRQRIVEIRRQQREADGKLQAEREFKSQSMDMRIKAQKELKEDQNKAEKTRGSMNNMNPEMRSKSNSNDDTNASRSSKDNDLKVISNPEKVSEELNIGIEEMRGSYEISPHKCSDDEDEEDDNDNMSKKKFVPAWASKNNVLLAVLSQQNLDPSIMFPANSFGDISKVVEPRKFQSRWHKV